MTSHNPIYPSQFNPAIFWQGNTKNYWFTKLQMNWFSQHTAYGISLDSWECNHLNDMLYFCYDGSCETLNARKWKINFHMSSLVHPWNIFHDPTWRISFGNCVFKALIFTMVNMTWVKNLKKVNKNELNKLHNKIFHSMKRQLEKGYSLSKCQWNSRSELCAACILAIKTWQEQFNWNHDKKHLSLSKMITTAITYLGVGRWWMVSQLQSLVWNIPLSKWDKKWRQKFSSSILGLDYVKVRTIGIFQNFNHNLNSKGNWIHGSATIFLMTEHENTAYNLCSSILVNTQWIAVNYLSEVSTCKTKEKTIMINIVYGKIESDAEYMLMFLFMMMMLFQYLGQTQQHTINWLINTETRYHDISWINWKKNKPMSQINPTP